MIRLILNGKKASIPEIREAVIRLRAEFDISVRVTWESGDVERFVKEAESEGIKRIIIGGGDGSVNEVVNTFHQLADPRCFELGVLPLGTANDFATACSIPSDYYEALRLACTGVSHLVDTVKVNDFYFMNVASAGFGAHVTATTPVELKNFLGGGAYTLHGLVNAIDFEAYPCSINCDGRTFEGGIIAGAICNGRMAGGGQNLAEEAYINDGLLDFVLLSDFTVEDLPQVTAEILKKSTESNFVKRFQAKKLSASSEHAIPLNLDGEPYRFNECSVEVVEKSIRLILPENCSVLKV